MARVLVHLKEAPPTRLLGLQAPKYTPSLLEVEVEDFRVVIEVLLRPGAHLDDLAPGDAQIVPLEIGALDCGLLPLLHVRSPFRGPRCFIVTMAAYSWRRDVYIR
jgi:hypothetical protein